MDKRRIIEAGIVEHCDFSSILDKHTPDEVIAVMEDYKRAYAGRDVYFKTERCGYSGDLSLELHERRPETDKEMKWRLLMEEKIAKEQAAKRKKQEEKELKEYQRLKKKFEGKQK